MQKFILTVFTIFLTASFSLCATTNSYEIKQALIKITTELLLNMINMDLKLTHIDKLQMDIILTINMVQKLEVIEKLHQAIIHMTNMAIKQEVLKRIQAV